MESSLVKTERELLEFLEVAPEPNANNIELLAYLRLIIHLKQIADGIGAMSGISSPKTIDLSPATIKALSDSINNNQAGGTQRPMGFIATGAGWTPRASSFSVTNIGEVPGVLGGMPLEVAETNNWSASPGKVLSAVPFDATGTKFKITYVIDAENSDTTEDGNTIRPLTLVHTQSEPLTEVTVKHNWGVDPLSVLITTLEKSKTELSWQFSEDSNSVIFRSTSPTTFKAILFGFR